MWARCCCCRSSSSRGPIRSITWRSSGRRSTCSGRRHRRRPAQPEPGGGCWGPLPPSYLDSYVKGGRIQGGGRGPRLGARARPHAETEDARVMKVVLLGASGMVGQGVLRECLLDDGVEKVLSVGRNASGCTHAKFAEMVLADLTRIEDLGSALEGCDACFDSLGASSAGMS